MMPVMPVRDPDVAPCTVLVMVHEVVNVGFNVVETGVRLGRISSRGLRCTCGPIGSALRVLRSRQSLIGSGLCMLDLLSGRAAGAQQQCSTESHNGKTF